MSILEKIGACAEAGHMEKQVVQYDISYGKALCECENCGFAYERPFTREEHERFRRELSEPMTI